MSLIGAQYVARWTRRPPTDDEMCQAVVHLLRAVRDLERPPPSAVVFSPDYDRYVRGQGAS